MQAVQTWNNTGYQKRTCKFPRIILLVILALIVFATVEVVVESHAKIHGGDAQLARDCIEKNGPDMTVAFDNRKYIMYCIIPDYGMGVVVKKYVDGKWQEITAYVKRGVTDPKIMIGYADEDAGSYGWISFVREGLRFLFGL